MGLLYFMVVVGVELGVRGSDAVSLFLAKFDGGGDAKSVKAAAESVEFRLLEFVGVLGLVKNHPEFGITLSAFGSPSVPSGFASLEKRREFFFGAIDEGDDFGFGGVHGRCGDEKTLNPCCKGATTIVCK